VFYAQLRAFHVFLENAELTSMSIPDPLANLAL
jgi:hypothetical protein